MNRRNLITTLLDLITPAGKIKKILMSCLLVVFTTNLFSQTATNNLNPQFDSPVPPSPNAAAFTKFGNIPIGPSTGIPQVTVPIYQYSSKNSGLSLPVSLDYHAGGVRVDEVASNVGLGWALNAGGVVSRVLKGVPDECSDGFLNKPYFDGATGDIPANDPSLKPFVKAYNRQLDLEEDLFSFNFNGRSGRFAYGRNGDILMIDAQKVKIEKEVTNVVTGGSNTEPMITKFTIIDENGVKYIFSAYEKTQLTNVSFHQQFTSSWYLTSIQAPFGPDNINLEYEDIIINDYPTSVSQTVASDLYPGGSNAVLVSYSIPYQRVNGKRIKKISLPQGLNLQFIYNTTPRTDLPNDYLLSRILIQDPNKQLGRGYILQQDYSLGNRATLLKVIPFAGLNAEVQNAPYQFFYKGGLPARLDNHQDHWGYPTFWDQTLHEERIPREIFAQNIGGRFELPGVNRDTDPIGCLAGSLYKIIYPTGGRTEFELEPNEADDGWLSQNFSVVVNDPPYLDKVESYNLYTSNGTPAYQDTYFTFNGEPDNTEFTLSLQPTTTGGCNGSCVLRAEIFPPTGAALISRDFNSPLGQSSVSFYLPNLVKGTQYRVRFYYNMLNISSYSAMAQLTWKEKQPETSHTEYYSHIQPYVGGLRAKKISDYDGISVNPASVREYEYKAEDGRSSGALATYPTYTYTTRYEGLINIVISAGGTYRGDGPPLICLRQSTSAYDIVYTNGSPVVYRRTIEYLKNNNKNNGKIERLFTVATGGSNGNFPFVPAITTPWLNGSLQKEIVYDASDNIVKTTVNTFSDYLMPDYSNEAVIKNFTSYTIAPVAFRIPDDFLDSDPPTSVKVANFPPVAFLYNDYLPQAGRRDIESTTITERDPVSGQTITTVNTNDYDPNYYYIKKKAFTNSKGQELAELYIYPLDKVAAGQTDPYQDMVSRNMINPVVETQQQLNQVMQRKLSTNYKKNWPDNTALILPQTVQSQVQTNPVDVRLRFYGYDNKGNPKSAGQENGMVTCYIWGYNKQFPIAEIKNADYATVESVLGGAAAISTFGDQVSPTDVAINNFLAPLRSDARLKNALITTYTYSPLYGVSSITDPNGNSGTYEYDGFGRLKLIRDQNGKILKQYDYQYQKPITQ